VLLEAEVVRASVDQEVLEARVDRVVLRDLVHSVPVDRNKDVPIREDRKIGDLINQCLDGLE
jgi:hypothetical protein